MALGLGFSTEETDPVTSDSLLITTFCDLSVSQLLAHLTRALLMCASFFPPTGMPRCTNLTFYKHVAYAVMFMNQPYNLKE